MKLEQYGAGNDKTIVMLHGANFVHCYGRQYCLAKKYHLVVPHIMGFGEEAGRAFDTTTCVTELAELIKGFSKKVLLVGFSLGAQLGFKLVAENHALFSGAILVSPWLEKTETSLATALRENEKQLASLKNKTLCNLIGLMNGLPKQARQDFVQHMQNVKPETIRNCVNNGISFESVPDFSKVPLPIAALAGAKEHAEIIESVKQMARLNPHCQYQVWEKAAHNIPPVFAKRFNALIEEMM